MYPYCTIRVSYRQSSLKIVYSAEVPFLTWIIETIWLSTSVSEKETLIHTWYSMWDDETQFQSKWSSIPHASKRPLAFNTLLISTPLSICSHQTLKIATLVFPTGLIFKSIPSDTYILNGTVLALFSLSPFSTTDSSRLSISASFSKHSWWVSTNITPEPEPPPRPVATEEDLEDGRLEKPGRGRARIRSKGLRLPVGEVRDRGEVGDSGRRGERGEVHEQGTEMEGAWVLTSSANHSCSLAFTLLLLSEEWATRKLRKN